MALATDLLAQTVRYWGLLLGVLVFARLLRNRYKSGLNKIPGPFAASLTNLWQFYHCFKGEAWKDYELHEKYNSPLLRIGPNTISVADPDAVRIIYGYKPTFTKARLFNITICKKLTEWMVE